jgi:hypothetical protein
VSDRAIYSAAQAGTVAADKAGIAAADVASCRARRSCRKVATTSRRRAEVGAALLNRHARLDS